MDNNKELQYILDCIENNQSVFITGPAGTGKTYLIKALQKILREKNINAVLTSTTGINALSIEGVTIHKFMGIGIQTSSSYLYVLKKSPFYKNICHRIMATDVIIIDEISMLRGDTFELINLVLQDVCNTKQPFGGKTMIFTGDFFQIPPVVKSWEEKQSQWIFQSDAWISGNIKPVILKNIFRQNDITFSNFLNNIRWGIVDKNIKKIINECLERKLPPDTTYFFSTRDECDSWNNECLAKIDEPEFAFNAKVSASSKNVNKNFIMKDCIAKQTLILKKGAKVVSIVNDPSGKYVNGSEGVVTKITPLGVNVKFLNGDETHVIKPFTWQLVDADGKVYAKIKQIPLLPSFALTIHKSQGMTLEHAIVDCKNIFASGQLYVALSRVRKLENLKIINFKMDQIIVNKEVTAYYKKLEKNYTLK